MPSAGRSSAYTVNVSLRSIRLGKCNLNFNVARSAVLCLNVEGFFTPLRHFIEGAIASGYVPSSQYSGPISADTIFPTCLPSFIRPENGVLLQFLDESPSQDWGEAALEALAKSTATGKPYALHWGEL